MRETALFIRRLSRQRKIELFLIDKKWRLMFAFFLLLLTLCWADYYYKGFVSGLDASDAPNNWSFFVRIVTVYFGLFIIILPLYLNVINSVEEMHRQKIENTSNLIARWDDDSLLDARDMTRFYGKKFNKLKQSFSDELHGKETNNNDSDSCSNSQNENPNYNNQGGKLERSAILVLNYFDNIRLDIKYNRIDIFMLNEGLGHVILDLSERFAKFAEDLSPQSAKDLAELRKYFMCL